MIILPDQIEVCAKKLYVYDVTQHGWEQEPNGPEANAWHVLTHLTKDLVKKDFKDPEIVRSDIIPDAMQYAIRLGRWAGARTTEILPLSGVLWTAQQTAKKMGDIPVHTAAWMEAAGFLARNLHDLGHERDYEKGRHLLPDSMVSAGRQLIESAQNAAENFEVDPIEAFDNRLNELRIRFNIPQPA